MRGHPGKIPEADLVPIGPPVFSIGEAQAGSQKVIDRASLGPELRVDGCWRVAGRSVCRWRGRHRPRARSCDPGFRRSTTAKPPAYRAGFWNRVLDRIRYLDRTGQPDYSTASHSKSDMNRPGNLSLSSYRFDFYRNRLMTRPHYLWAFICALS